MSRNSKRKGELKTQLRSQFRVRSNSSSIFRKLKRQKGTEHRSNHPVIISGKKTKEKKENYHWPIKGKKKHTVLLHNLQELDDDLRGRSDQHLALAGLLSVVDGVQSVSQNGGSSHSKR